MRQGTLTFHCPECSLDLELAVAAHVKARAVTILDNVIFAPAVMWTDNFCTCWVQFARLYPLGQHDLPIERKHVDFGPLCPASVRIENPSRDYTPPSKHLFTSLRPMVCKATTLAARPCLCMMPQ